MLKFFRSSIFLTALFPLLMASCDIEDVNCGCRILDDGSLNFKASVKEDSTMIVQVQDPTNGQARTFIRAHGKHAWRDMSTAKPIDGNRELSKSLMQCQILYGWHKKGWAMATKDNKDIVEAINDSLSIDTLPKDTTVK